MPTQPVHVYENGELVDTYEEDVPDAPPTDAERIAALEAKLAAVEALATKANAAAQEAAQAVKDAKPTR